jgi:hypothetical protein
LFLLCLSSSCGRYGTQDKEKQNKKNREKLATWGTQDEEKQGNNNAGKLFCFVCLCLVYPMLPVSLDCFCIVCLCLVYLMLPVSLDWFCFVFKTKKNKAKTMQGNW